MTDKNSNYAHARQNLLDQMQAGRDLLNKLLDNAPMDGPVLTNGWSARDWLVHLRGWEVRIAALYTALSAGQEPDWDLNRIGLDAVNAQIQSEAGQYDLSSARAAEEAAYQRLREIALSAPAKDLFDPLQFAWMNAISFAEWVGDNTFGHIEEHHADWIGLAR